uniref:Uncharacterized protein n=1 Tax=Arundo donax TaxID=35708 RepID=A0A0A9DU04_ARUDO
MDHCHIVRTRRSNVISSHFIPHSQSISRLIPLKKFLNKHEKCITLRTTTIFLHFLQEFQ